MTRPTMTRAMTDGRTQEETQDNATRASPRHRIRPLRRHQVRHPLAMEEEEAVSGAERQLEACSAICLDATPVMAPAMVMVVMDTGRTVTAMAQEVATGEATLAGVAVGAPAVVGAQAAAGGLVAVVAGQVARQADRLALDLHLALVVLRGDELCPFL